MADTKVNEEKTSWVWNVINIGGDKGSNAYCDQTKNIYHYLQTQEFMIYNKFFNEEEIYAILGKKIGKHE